MKQDKQDIAMQNTQSEDDDATMHLPRQSQQLAKALATINRYMQAENPDFRNGHGITRQELEEMRAEQRACLHILAGIPDPLVQAITAKLTLDGHHRNAGVMIRELIGKVYNTTC